MLILENMRSQVTIPGLENKHRGQMVNDLMLTHNISDCQVHIPLYNSWLSGSLCFCVPQFPHQSGVDETDVPTPRQALLCI